jgi:hypothetical protein
MCFLHLVGSTGHIVHSIGSVPQKIGALFFMLGLARCGFHKKNNGACYVKLMFLHPVGSAGYVLHSGLSGVPSIDALFFMLRRAQCDFYKKRAKHITPNLWFCTRRDLRFTWCIQVHPRNETLMHNFSCLGGPDVVSIKIASGHIM